MKKKFKIQNSQYLEPYHHYVNVSKDEFKLLKSLFWGIEYYSYVSFLLNIVESLNFSKLVEVGCGDGKITLEIAKRFRNKNIEGYDLSEQAILFAKSYGFGYNNLSFYCEDFKKSKEKYDIILLVEVLEHIPDDEIESFMNLLASKLNTNGKLVLSVPSKNLKLHPKHYRHYNLNLLKNHVNSSFRIKSHYFVHNCKSKIYWLLNRVFVNRLFVLNEPIISKWLIKFYNKYFRKATSKNGAHLVAILEKK